MNPYLDRQNNPHVKIEALLTTWKMVDCLIDTGFSGGIALPETYLNLFKHEPVGFQEYELADGSLTTFAIYKTKVRFKNKTSEITLFFTKSSEGLVGIEFLLGFIWILNYKDFSIEVKI